MERNRRAFKIGIVIIKLKIKMKKTKKEIRAQQLFDKVQELRAKYPEMVLTKKQIAHLLSKEEGADGAQTIYNRIARIEGI